MNNCLRTKKTNCKNCYKCIRNCPIKSISFSENQATIVKEECILCGQCFVVCPQNAKEIRNDLQVAKGLIKESDTVIASIAPSFVANYDNATILTMEKALTKLGFAGVEETAIGATLVKDKYDEMVLNEVSDVIISSCCHSVNLLIQMHFPGALKYLAPVISPMQAHCMDIKRRFPKAKTVFIGPCISKKDEAEIYKGYVDCVLTFDELTEWLQEENITLEHIDDSNKSSKARFFPTSGGILKTMTKPNPDYTYVVVDGLENCINAINDILSGRINKCFIEMSACSGSCIQGPAINKQFKSPVRDYIKVNNYAGDKDFDVEVHDDDKMKKDFNVITQRRVKFGESAIQDVLRKMGKTKPEDELNCGSCGYNTCREKAEAVLYGKADLTMCLPYLKEKAESFSDTIIKNAPNAIIVLNEALEVQQINKAALDLMKIHHESDVLGEPVVRILDPSVFINARKSGRNIYEKSLYLAEYRKYVEQTVIYDKEYKIIICLMRDITDFVKQQAEKEELTRRTIEIADKVVEKQMRSVQEIASLLGETTAETKVALTKLKESLKNE